MSSKVSAPAGSSTAAGSSAEPGAVLEVALERLVQVGCVSSCRSVMTSMLQLQGSRYPQMSFQFQAN